eukprot:CAMPEP_0118670706 /NCGR_PEP_ID=MMETSP0785-20121206/21607_1 /TAXON_ID=91992 /ORGANISM="Bolidomonas pacifica, Strain CCMP 1866" /LENGTH=41 /DNA_ID= /DNA_START= /DNA_END= /DNA_ORIENTATION=
MAKNECPALLLRPERRPIPSAQIDRSLTPTVTDSCTHAEAG